MHVTAANPVTYLVDIHLLVCFMNSVQLKETNDYNGLHDPTNKQYIMSTDFQMVY
jgi:hypothetical protein